MCSLKKFKITINLHTAVLRSDEMMTLCLVLLNLTSMGHDFAAQLIVTIFQIRAEKGNNE
jgi:hypothetical protein